MGLSNKIKEKFDKKDAVDTFVLEYIRQMVVSFTDIIKRSDGRLFDGIINAYHAITKGLVNEIYRNVYKNIKYFSDFANGIIFSKRFNERYDYIVDWIIENTYEGKNKMISKKNIKILLDMLSAILTQSTFRYLIEENKKNIENDFKTKLEILKIGILNNKVGV